MDYSQSKIVTQASTRQCPAHVLTFGGCPLCEAPRHSCSSLLFLITLFHFLPALSLCLLLVPQAAGSASLPFVTPAGTSGEDKTLWPHHWEKSKGMSRKGKSHNAIKRWGEKPHGFNNESHQAPPNSISISGWAAKYGESLQHIIETTFLSCSVYPNLLCFHNVAWRHLHL